mgnify:CR=1 FL=1
MNMPFDDREGVVVLGGTGSIGHNALAVLASMPERFRLEAVTCRCSLEKLVDLTKDFSIGMDETIFKIYCCFKYR